MANWGVTSTKKASRKWSQDISKLTREWPLLLTLSLVVALDQISKFLVRANLAWGQSVPEDGFFRITYITNAGASWGMFGNAVFLTIATAVVIIVTIAIYWRYPQAKRTPIKIALGLLIGGSLGNMIDRVTHGRVTSFIDVGAWPIFNVADVAIVVGVCIIAAYLIFSLSKEKQTSKPKDG